MQWIVEPSPLGKIVVAPALPPSAALFYTTADFDGSLNAASTSLITTFLEQRFGISAGLSTCRQVHGTEAVRISSTGRSWQECDSCDALWTARRGAALGIKVADCLPVTLVDSDNSVIANIHAGWRGAAAGITSRTVAGVAAASPFDPARAKAWLGPSIRVCCFEVGEEVVSAFPSGERYARRSGPRPHFDLAAFTRQTLIDSGFSADAIFDSELCTRCDGSLFHSYRRGGPAAGRNLALVAQ